MAATPSTMLALGTPAPDLNLPDVTRPGTNVSLSDFADQQALVVMFICAHCPFVKHVKNELARLARDYSGRGVGFVAITSNDVENYPDDAPEPTAKFARESGWTFPVLYDERQLVAQAYSAACTPDFFVFNRERLLVYRGQLDETRPDRGAPHGRDLRAALDALLAGGRPSTDQKPSIGCNIKWKPGNEPAYFR